MPTERGWYRFWTKEGADGLFIAAEPAGDTLPSLNGILGFELKKGSNIEEANNIANFLNQNVTCLTLTTNEPQRKTEPQDQTTGNYAPPQDDHE